MKKYILSPLCSALVIPGLGQILNRNLVKGVVILSLVFILFVGGTVKLAMMIRSLVNQIPIAGYAKDTIMKKLEGEDLSIILYITVAFLILWTYSVIDALWMGLKLERRQGRHDA